MGRARFAIFAGLMIVGTFLAGAALLAFNHAAYQADRQTYTIEPGRLLGPGR